MGKLAQGLYACAAALSMGGIAETAFEFFGEVRSRFAGRRGGGN